MKTEKIGRGTWLDKVASSIIEREQKLRRPLSLIRVESGLGASGIPHVGSLGDAVRAYGVKLALEDQGYRSELIAYSDDLDGLRKVPEGLPEWLKQYLAYPVSTIPDPFGCHSSYAAHMSSMLTDGLDRLGVEYRFQSGAEAYRSGLLKDQIVKILGNSQRIGGKIAEMLGQKKFEEVLPYYPICGRCGRIYLAEAYRYIPGEEKILYRCRGGEIGRRMIEGCGYEGEADLAKGEGKLSWKGEFAARWAKLDIRFEAYGKDIADSVRVNDWIAEEVLGYPPPLHVKYELFLDKSGRKISKSLGNVFTPQAWLTYGTPQSLLLLMYKRIAGTRNLSTEDIPTYMDEYDTLEDIYFGKVKEENPAKLMKLRGLYEYINHLTPPQSPKVHTPYRMLVQIASVAPKENAVEYVVEKLKRIRAVETVDEELKEKAKLALNWAEDFKATLSKTFTADAILKATLSKAFPADDILKVSLTEDERMAISELVDYISGVSDPEVVQNKIFELAKAHSIKPPEFFRTLYKILIGSERGPRLGPYIVDIGVEKAAKILSEHIEK